MSGSVKLEVVFPAAKLLNLSPGAMTVRKNNTPAFTRVIADTPPGTPTSLPRVPAITTENLSVVRLHGRRSELWGARDAQVVEKYRYLYDREELEDWLAVILELAEQTEQLHIVFNNCYANYGTTNALEMTGMLLDSPRV